MSRWERPCRRHLPAVTRRKWCDLPVERNRLLFGATRSPGLPGDFCFATAQFPLAFSLRSGRAPKNQLETGREYRSEESRVGKECVSRCRYGWSPKHRKKKTTCKTK